jgi:UDP-galactopyranose mutase
VFQEPELLIVGAGPTGCTIAERAARELGWRCLVVEKRDHVGGACHDRLHPSGIRVHPYGRHFFHTSDPDVLQYLSRFTRWRSTRCEVQASRDGVLYPFPINLETLERFFGLELDAESAQALLDDLRDASITQPVHAEAWALAHLGRELYQAFYEGYTRKQWGLHPMSLPPEIYARIPVRLTHENRYTDDRYELIPDPGYTELFEAMLNHPRIRVERRTSYRQIREQVRPLRALVYTGALDELFDSSEGQLPWRALDVRMELVEKPFVQPCAQINHPQEHDYTRSVEIKHITRQEHPHTVIAYETPCAHGEPAYPVPSQPARRLHARYLDLARAREARGGFYFAGRLAEYRYMSTAQAIQGALTLFERIRRDHTGR